ncbi:DnaJ domain-containing protein [Desulfobacter curvatus]|uniref:DnaJ domain-containing protein n=1 Tax=Desulfobacter curvatus TaxID=2290 RepID=UPI0012FC47AA|nr:DnaJ domain-containing protein [Desulfobacter curvatus]
MDKQKALDLLGLAPSATRADARTAFRKLAKTWHPDRFAKDPLKAKIAEKKMKQLNGAFHFLLPLLPDMVVEQHVGQNPSDFKPGCVQTHRSGKTFQRFFSALAAGLKKCSNGRRKVKVQTADHVGETHKPRAHFRTGTAGRARETKFETMFQNAVNHNPAGTKPRLQPQTGSPGRYTNCRNYFGLVSGRPINMVRMRNRGVGPVEKISPISPVSSVKRH